MNPTENAEWWKMTPNSFPNLACLDTIIDGASVSSWLSLGTAQLFDCGGVPVWSRVEQIVVNIP